MLVILGPTSSGKSVLAVRLAKRFKGEVVSADSRQVYRGMNLGTGKITKKEMEQIPHHLLDVASPRKRFDASRYQKLAKTAIKKISLEGKLPILCGGTGFYISSVVDKLSLPKIPPDWRLRKRLEKKSSPALFRLLVKLDKRRAGQIDRSNPRRLIRAIEIVRKSKEPIPRLKKNSSPYNLLVLGIKKSRAELARRIKKRLLARIRAGLINEVRRLKEAGLSWKKLESFGLEYRWVSRYLQKKVGKKEMTERLAREIVNYAKRQMTWFKRDKRIKWVRNEREAERLVKKFLGSL